MKVLQKVSLVFSLFLTFGVVLAASALDFRGGVTYDFAELSARRFQPDADSSTENLLVNGDFSLANDAADRSDPYRWRDSYYYIHNPDNRNIPSWRERIRSLITWEIADSQARIVKPMQLQEICGAMLKDTSSAWSKYVRLPDSEGGTFRLSFQYQARHDSQGANYVLATCRGEHEKPERSEAIGSLKTLPFADEWGEWGLFSQEIVAPAGTRYLDLIFRIDGAGELLLKNVVLAPVKKQEKLTLRLSPQGFLDRIFTLSQGQPATMSFVWKRNGSVEEAKLTKPQLVLTLPKGVEFLHFPNADSATVKDLPDGQEIRVQLGHNYASRPQRINGFDFYLVLPALLTSSLEAGSSPGMGSCYIEDQGKVVSNQENFQFEVIAPIKVSARAKKYLPGFYIGGLYLSFDDKNNAFMARFLEDVGVRWIIGSPSGNRLEMWKKHNIDVVTPELYYVANGFRVGEPKNRPESDKYKYLGGDAHSDLAWATCPAAIYEKRPYFQESIRKYLADNLKGTDGLWANWEPYMFAGKGCFCDYCMANFAKFVGVPLEQMKTEWPDQLSRGKKYYEQAVRFRSLEHAKLVRTIDEAVVELTGGEKSLGFIPGIAWIEMASCWRSISAGKEVHQSDYASDLRWIDPWGPYPCWNTQSPYVYRKASALSTFVAARDVRKQVNLDYPPEKRPKLLAFPHGIQGSAWVTQPESMEMDLNSFFFNGYEAATLYIFPRGYDNRYWAAFARAAELVAKFEDFVFDGQRIDERVSLTAQAPYALNATKVTSYLPELNDVPMLQHVAYEKDGKIIVPVFNFWEKGSAFFSLQISGLPNESRYQLSCAEQYFAPERSFFRQRKYFTGSELASGISLFAGAMRCLVYEFVPADSSSVAISYSPADVRQLRSKLLPELTAAAAADQEYEERYGVRKSTLLSLEHAGIKCQADNENSQLLFTAGENSAILNSKAMSMVDWRIAGKAQLGGTAESGLGTVAFWEPSFLIETTWQVIGQEKIPGGISVTGELRIHDQLSTVLDGLTIRQRFEITDSCRKVTVKTELLNTSSDELPRALHAGLRYHCFPMALAAKGATVELWKDDKPVHFTRNFGRNLFFTGDTEFEKVIRSTFEISDASRQIDRPYALFRTAAGQVELKLEPAAEFVGFALWDGGNQLTSTFEPCFKIKTLEKIGDKATYSLSMEAK